MPTKKNVIKQRQKQTTIVNINLAKAKARARASAKKSGAKSRGGRNSVMMLPPPIYTSPIDRLTPAMYSSQGQQIQQQSLDQLLKNFLSNQQNQQVGSFKTLGSAPGSTDNLNKPFKSFQDYQDLLPKIRKKTPEELEIIKEKYRKDLINKGIDPYQYQEIPTPFNNEERSYLSAAEPDYESALPFYNRVEPSIYETLRSEFKKMDDEKYKN